MTRYACAILIFVTPIAGAEVFIRTPTNEQYVVDVTTAEQVRNVKIEIAPVVQMSADRMLMIHEGKELQDQESIAPYRGKEVFVMTNQTGSQHRNYDHSISETDQETIRYIFTTLANTGQFKLLSKTTDIREAGEKIRHVHPLKVLEFILTDDELKAAMVVITGKRFVWRPFARDMSESLQKEQSRDNLNAHHLKQFADTISIDLALIKSLADQKRWIDFIRTAILSVPRDANTTRYNM